MVDKGELPDLQRFLPIPFAAIRAGVSCSTIRRLLKDGSLTALRPGGRRVVIDREELDRFVLSTAEQVNDVLSATNT